MKQKSEASPKNNVYYSNCYTNMKIKHDGGFCSFTYVFNLHTTDCLKYQRWSVFLNLTFLLHSGLQQRVTGIQTFLFSCCWVCYVVAWQSEAAWCNQQCSRPPWMLIQMWMNNIFISPLEAPDEALMESDKTWLIPTQRVCHGWSNHTACSS